MVNKHLSTHRWLRINYRSARKTDEENSASLDISTLLKQAVDVSAGECVYTVTSADYGRLCRKDTEP